MDQELTRRTRINQKQARTLKRSVKNKLEYGSPKGYGYNVMIEVRHPQDVI